MPGKKKLSSGGLCPRKGCFERIPGQISFESPDYLADRQDRTGRRNLIKGMSRGLTGHNSTMTRTLVLMDPQTEFEIIRAQEMHEFVADHLAGTYPNNDVRRTLFAAFLSLAQSHHEAIMVLCRQEHLIGSAYALSRPLVEVSSRGLFAAFLATREQIESIRTGGKPYGPFNEVVKKLDDRLKTEGLFTRYGGESWSMLCGLAHGGLEQLNRRVGDNCEIGCHSRQKTFSVSYPVQPRSWPTWQPSFLGPWIVKMSAKR
jgi:hypothetical protein